ncbi:tetratricopeptide repeat protein [Candidatus Thorarchaeota archaeon]|nr:MAG: tetratricopeptide repeat protein [Candidatus Thorarchaeota archaeon]
MSFLSMSPSPEIHLQEAIRLHQISDFKKGLKEAEKARKQFQKEGRIERAVEALRVMGDCTLNTHDLKKAEKIYLELLEQGVKLSSNWFQAAAYWGLGQVASHRMDYPSAIQQFQKGLDSANSITDKWYIAWNAFGLGNALRGLSRVEEAQSAYQVALRTFRDLNQVSFVTWVEKALNQIGSEAPRIGSQDEIRIWLCPLCGSKFNPDQANALRNGKMATCQYCGTTAG